MSLPNILFVMTDQQRFDTIAALGAFLSVGGRDYGRVDVMVRADGSPVVLEVNTLPGMTETSLLPMAAAEAPTFFAPSTAIVPT